MSKSKVSVFSRLFNFKRNRKEVMAKDAQTSNTINAKNNLATSDQADEASTVNTLNSKNPIGTIESIKKVIETQINPYLAMHQGGAEFVDFEDGVVTLKLFGGCSGCPSSQLTLFNGIVPILKEHFPEIIEDVVLA